MKKIIVFVLIMFCAGISFAQNILPVDTSIHVKLKNEKVLGAGFLINPQYYFILSYEISVLKKNGSLHGTYLSGQVDSSGKILSPDQDLLGIIKDLQPGDKVYYDNIILSSTQGNALYHAPSVIQKVSKH